MIMDGVKEHTMGNFRMKCREAGFWVKQTKPYTAWSNAAKAAIRELKKGFLWQIVQSKAPKRLWDGCVEWEGFNCFWDLPIKLLTFHHLPRSNGTNGCSFLETHPYLVPAIDIGPAMTRKILKANRRVMYWSTLWLLTPPNEMAGETMTKLLDDSFKWYEDFWKGPAGPSWRLWRHYHLIRTKTMTGNMFHRSRTISMRRIPTLMTITLLKRSTPRSTTQQRNGRNDCQALSHMTIHPNLTQATFWITINLSNTDCRLAHCAGL